MTLDLDSYVWTSLASFSRPFRIHVSISFEVVIFSPITYVSLSYFWLPFTTPTDIWQPFTCSHKKHPLCIPSMLSPLINLLLFCCVL